MKKIIFLLALLTGFNVCAQNGLGPNPGLANPPSLGSSSPSVLDTPASGGIKLGTPPVPRGVTTSSFCAANEKGVKRDAYSELANPKVGETFRLGNLGMYVVRSIHSDHVCAIDKNSNVISNLSTSSTRG